MHVIYRSGSVFFSWLPYNVLYIKKFTANLLVFVQSVYNFIRTVKRLVQAGLLIGHSVWGFSSKTCSLPVICRIIIHSEHIQRNAIVLKWRLVFHPPPLQKILYLAKLLYSSTYAESKKTQLYTIKLIFR